MNADKTFASGDEFAAHLKQLRAARKGRVLAEKQTRRTRRALSGAARAEILRKAGGRCHICGGLIEENDWEADHVFAHSAGGRHSLDNYLPAHSLCNNYRWHYDAEEFQWILKLGVWLRTEIERARPLGRDSAERFVSYDRNRAKRRRPKTDIVP